MLRETMHQGRRYTVKVPRNDITTLRLTLKDELGDPYDLTGLTVSLLVKRKFTDAAVLHTVSGSVQGDAANGIVDFALTATHTGEIGEFVAEVEATDAVPANGTESVLMFTLEVTYDVG